MSEISFISQRNEEENRRKSLTLTIVVHSILFLLFLIPFISPRPSKLYEKAIVINFEEPSSSSSSSSTASSSSGSRPRVAMARIEPAPAASSVEVPRSKPVITSPEPELKIPEAQEDFFEEPLEVTEAAEVDDVAEIRDQPADATERLNFGDWAVEEGEETPSDAPAPLTPGDGGEGESSDDSGFFDGDFEGAAESGDDPFADGFFDGDWPGGDGSEGTRLGIGNLGDGNYYGDFAGEGLFDRKVIKRADVAKLAVKQGKLVINICVDEEGKVYWAEANEDKSTISDEGLNARAREVAMTYLFEPEPGNERDCGMLSFIFKIDK